MERQDIDQSSVDYWRTTYFEEHTVYGPYSEPLPGSRLKLDDDVLWLDNWPVRVLWGTDYPDVFYGYCPSIFGDIPVPLEAQYIQDRAPVDPEDLPAMPIYEEE